MHRELYEGRSEERPFFHNSRVYCVCCAKAKQCGGVAGALPPQRGARRIFCRDVRKALSTKYSRVGGDIPQLVLTHEGISQNGCLCP
jgi:hypothetical protein